MRAEGSVQFAGSTGAPGNVQRSFAARNAAQDDMGLTLTKQLCCLDVAVNLRRGNQPYWHGRSTGHGGTSHVQATAIAATGYV